MSPHWKNIMDELVRAFANFEARLRQWGEDRPDVTALVIIGSRARTRYPADAWSDLDVLLVVSDPQVFIASTGWLHELGDVWLTFLEGTATGTHTERRALFAGGVDVDFVPLPADQIRAMFTAEQFPPEFVETARRGVRFLVDKENFAAHLPAFDPPEPTPLHNETAFLNLVHDFWYHTVWAAKKLRRGELWTALGALNIYLPRQCLLPLVEWQAQPPDAWFKGRFIEAWADPVFLEQAAGIIAHYDTDDAWRALQVQMDLFSQLAPQVARQLGCSYPRAAETQVRDWLRSIWP
jgi:aminoglycoside 6-adenylyltransferase